jgi:hypothetical protein
MLRYRMSGVVFPLLLYALMVSTWMAAFTVLGETVTLQFYSVECLGVRDILAAKNEMWMKIFHCV